MAWPVEEGTLMTSMLGMPRSLSSSWKACPSSLIFLDMNREALLRGSFSRLPWKSQTKEPIPALLILRPTVRSHSLRAFNPTNTNSLVSGKHSERTSVTDSVSSLSTRFL